MEQSLIGPTKLEYYDDLSKLQSTANLLSSVQIEDGRQALVLDSIIFQPSNTGFISNSEFKFIVQDVRSKDKIVYHYGHFENTKDGTLEDNIEKGVQVLLSVDETRRELNSRLHSAGHLLDICVRNVVYDHLELTKGSHFPDGPFVEYKGTVQHNELESKKMEIELEANNLISKGGQHSSNHEVWQKPRCPCGGIHVDNINEISNITVSQIRMKKKDSRKFFYHV